MFGIADELCGVHGRLVITFQYGMRHVLQSMTICTDIYLHYSAKYRKAATKGSDEKEKLLRRE